MEEYEFILTFSLQHPAEDPSNYEEALERNGCTDALLGIGRSGIIALDFAREAGSAYEAISSAITDVKRSIPNAILTEIAPDFVGITDIAALVDRSRQNIRKLIFADGSRCPPPAHSGSFSVWHLYDVLQWLKQDKDCEISKNLIEIAKIAKSINVLRALEQIAPDTRREIGSMLDESWTDLPALSV